MPLDAPTPPPSLVRLDRKDGLFVIACVLVAVVCALLFGRMRLAGALLGVAVAVKLYPGVLLPIAATWAAARAGRRAAGDL